MTKPTAKVAVVGAVEHGNSALLVTVTPDGHVLDRRRVDLTSGLPTHPYHHEGAWAVGRYLNSPWARPISLVDAIALIERVHAAADRGASMILDALSASVPARISCIAIRACPTLPATIEERIRDNRAQVVADSVMYRRSLSDAANARGWSVCWYDRVQVMNEARAVLGCKDIDAFLNSTGRSIGPPWQAGHKLAAAAAIAASRGNAINEPVR